MPATALAQAQPWASGGHGQPDVGTFNEYNYDALIKPQTDECRRSSVCLLSGAVLQSGDGKVHQ
ncbi:hypothetical protein GCM10011400_68010 [Paraburkholderia caffeinilytica]|uniref:Uncharacterized protein n=1 Tax=Paraburkholderia caffeinilytica TaxID=1761016 RepID=A0ABQ1NFD5_9BURK|nr:hypothetical protein GCM10011400_68010 [Paraburkholderia caffeinilytica]